MAGKWYMLFLAGIISISIAMYGFSVWCLLVGSFLVYHSLKDKTKGRIHLLFLVFSFILFYSATTFYDIHNQSRYPLSLQNQSLLLSGQIHSMPSIDGDRLRFELKTNDKEKVQVQYYLHSVEEQHQLRQLKKGMRCTLRGELRKPAPATNFNGFDYEQYLYEKGIHLVFTPTAFESCHNGRWNGINELIELRQKGIESVRTSIPEPTAGIVAALVYGDRSFMEEDVLQAYQRLGIIHLLAVSGLHVGLVSGAIYFLLIRIGVTRERTIDILLLILPVYIVIAGGAPSVIRAATMVMIALLFKRLKKNIQPLDLVSIIGMIYLLVQPFSLFHIGFQLSFLTTIALLLSVFMLKEKSYVQLLFFVTGISQLISLPFILHYFYEISVLSVPLNFIFIPLVSFIILPLSILLTLLLPVSTGASQFVTAILTPLIHVSHMFLLYVDSFSFGKFSVGKLPSSLVVALFGTIAFLLMRSERKTMKNRLILPILLVTLILVAAKIAPYVNENGEITVLDVGQGDCILIEFPYRKSVYLLDAGGLVAFNNEKWREKIRTFEVGKDVVLPYLKSKGITKIDKLILSHGHYDHIGGVESLLGEVEIKEVLYSQGVVEGEFEKQLLQQLYESGSSIRFIGEGERWKEGEAQFIVLSPQGHEQSLNNRSIVIYAFIGGYRWLFTGDLEQEGETRIIQEYTALPVDVLKVGHHGSKTSSTPLFVEHISPSIALIPVGKQNRFGHPHPDVIKGLEEKGIIIYRTDQHGAIRFRFTDKVKQFETKIKKQGGLP
ncbi:DNA internalization-related competence protein ComEC/Rec2 [Alkalihalobacillus sp. LMS39]|uniref:DNA internalization-related competence protein ComEC/Rec2 n=1 Tax=Alkalihalobacillus sp. LMS39 TaxID=2924032 RepID=UPI001FB4353F|nr:DNA internalization-related competence protein ComEC/Rec2 [Alkalihalobacillus sp. LMS39]UOE95631.1 DNA internalization-related competence protein ComEC/Rec2 [Alkalihalobacillus sp. LMS39]